MFSHLSVPTTRIFVCKTAEDGKVNTVGHYTQSDMFTKRIPFCLLEKMGMMYYFFVKITISRCRAVRVKASSTFYTIYDCSLCKIYTIRDAQ